MERSLLSLFCSLDVHFLYCRRLEGSKGLHAWAVDEVSSLEYQDRQEPLLDGKELVSPTKTRNGNFALAWNVLLDSHDLALSALESRQLCLQVCKVLLTGWQCGGQLQNDTNPTTQWLFWDICVCVYICVYIYIWFISLLVLIRLHLPSWNPGCSFCHYTTFLKSDLSIFI